MYAFHETHCCTVIYFVANDDIITQSSILPKSISFQNIDRGKTW